MAKGFMTSLWAVEYGRRMGTPLAEFEISLYDGGASQDAMAAGDSHLRVCVVHTTPEGTHAALRSAARLAKDLSAQIVLLAAEAVPFHFSMERPHVPARFLERRLLALSSEAEMGDAELTIKVSLCRNRRTALATMLAPRSLVTIGADMHWWHRHDRAMAKWLRERGHHVIIVSADAKKRTDPKQDRGRMAQYLRSLTFEPSQQIRG
jgi:hypothetical protein